MTVQSNDGAQVQVTCPYHFLFQPTHVRTIVLLEWFILLLLVLAYLQHPDCPEKVHIMVVVVPWPKSH